MRSRTKLERAAMIAVVAGATVGWVDIADRIIAHGGPRGIARSWRMHRIDAFLEPWAARHPDPVPRAAR